MTMIATDLTPLSAEAPASLLEDRFILTQVFGGLTLIFPATWVAEILRVDRSQILDLPNYNPLLVGIIDRNGQITPLVAAAHLLEIAQPTLPARLVVVRLNRSSDGLGNVGIIVDRLVGTIIRQELPPDLFITHRINDLIMMRSALVPTEIWQPKSC
jgi:chemotaxis signal transduction protein